MPRSVQWLNANRYRRYPFVENSSLSASGGLVLPDSAIVDFQVTNYLYEAGPVRLVQFTIVSGTPKTGVFRFQYSVGDTVDLSVPESAAFPFRSTVHDSSLHNVVCVFGEGIIDLLQNAPGTYFINAEIEPALCGFQDKHRLLSVEAEGATTLEGPIVIREGYGCLVTIQTDQNAVRIAASKGAGAGIPCDELDPDRIKCNEVFLRINGLQADSLGAFTLVGMDGVEVIPEPDEHRIRIRAKIQQDELVCG